MRKGKKPLNLGFVQKSALQSPKIQEECIPQVREIPNLNVFLSDWPSLMQSNKVGRVNQGRRSVLSPFLRLV